jgi:hypothetical protein
MGELGFFGSVIPEKYGGNGLGFLAMTLITEEIARVHSAVRVAINMQIGPALALLQFGNEEQKKKWIPPLLRANLSAVLLSPELMPFRCIGDKDDGSENRRLCYQWTKLDFTAGQMAAWFMLIRTRVKSTAAYRLSTLPSINLV